MEGEFALCPTLKLALAASLLALGVGSAQATNLFGIDVSAYQGAIDWTCIYANAVKAKTSHFLHPVIYCSAGTGACNLIEYDKSGGITLSPWIANYNGQSLYTGQPWTCCTCCDAWVIGCGTGNWAYWQTGSGPICGITCGFDAFNGTLAQLISSQGVN